MTYFSNLKAQTFVLTILLLNTAFSAVGSLVTITETSTSGKTIVINSGRLDGRQLNEFGVLVQKTKEPNKQTIFKPVAKLKCIKLYDTSSVWVSYKTYLISELKVNRELLMLSESEMLKGRRKLTTSRTKLVTGANELKELKPFLKESEDGLQYKKNYSVAAKGHDKKNLTTTDINLVDIDTWDEDDLDKKKTPRAIFRSSRGREFLKVKRVQTFEKMVVAFLNKFNNPSFNYDDFFREQKRTQYSYTLPAKGTAQTYKELYEKKVLDKIAKEDKFRAEIKSRGDAWSDGYSNEELSELLNDINRVQEKQRRRKLANFKSNSQGYISLGLNLADNEAKGARETTSSNKIDFELAWEVFLLKNYEKLSKFTFEISLRNSNDAFDAGSINVASRELSVALQANWYLNHGPEVIGRNILYVGLLSRFGSSRLSSEAAGEEGNYQISSFPALKFGLKYNFKNSYGVRGSLGLENINVSRLERSSDEGALPDNVSYFEAKMAIGLSKFF